MNKQLTFDEVFKIWLDNEISSTQYRDVLSFVATKGFTSIAEWRLQTALKLGMDKREWTLETIDNPHEELPKIKVGPYKGWSNQNGIEFFKNELNTSFAEAVEMPEFFDWVSKHDRIIPISKNFPLPTTLILFRKENGDLIHIEGGHRICAVAYTNKIGEPIEFEGKPPVSAAIANISDEEIKHFLEVMQQGTDKK
ncbi:MAG TPA: hypothetical protein VHQ20_01170 [Patescibacteria group bacterium]|jgi:hypothetical protein|nr:hypothetical protein [Patescibacteria group bacterium]